jgi:nitrate reductase delta subunit
MVDLLNVYNQNGYDLTANELPDHIPLFLEYLSQRPDSEITQWLTEIDHILALLGERLAQREHPYQFIFQSLLSLLETNVDMDQIRNSVAAEVPDNTPEALDKVWEEEAVRFGGDDPTGACASAATTRKTQQVSVDSIKRNNVSH